MKLWVGTSGFSYKEWKGSFYPEDLPAKAMLRYYGERLPAVEINNTFYRLPKTSVLESWAEQVPDGFRFVLKASRKITHFKRLKDAAEETEYLFNTALALGDRLGAILFQLPPYLRKDVERLEKFLAVIPDPRHAAFEFRHLSWFEDEVYQCLQTRGCALCIADTEDAIQAGVVPTANWGYLRLRRPDYDESTLRQWVKRVASQNWEHAYVFFKHEDEAAGPRLAKHYLDLAGQD